MLGIIHLRSVELPLARTTFHGPQPVQAIEVLLYISCYCKSVLFYCDDTKRYQKHVKVYRIVHECYSNIKFIKRVAERR